MSHIKSCDKIVITGSIAYDDIMNFPGYFKDHFHAKKLHQINISFVVDRLEKHLGGTATNIAYGASLSSKKPVYVLGAMGKDHEQITDFFTKNKIDYSKSIISKELFTSTGKVMTDKADNQIWSYYYGAGALGHKIDFTEVKSNSFFVISANHKSAFLHAQNYCIENSIPYLYDPGMALTWIDDKDLLEGIRHSKFIIGNDYEISQIEKRLGKGIINLIKKGSGVITTLGDKGVRYQDNSQKINCPAYSVKNFKDPTGAGDSWRGGFIAKFLEGKPIKDCLAFANALASFAIETVGTVNHKPSLEEIEARAESILNFQLSITN